jgi:phage nucleotide-binding protein
MEKSGKILIEKSPEVLNRGVAILIYSDPGIGKTTLATTLPHEETLIINTEAGIGPLLGQGIYVFHVKKAMEINKISIEQVMEGIYEGFRTKQLNFKNVVIDNLSELHQTLLHHYTDVRNKDFPEIREQGDTAYKMTEWINNWRDLVDMGINVVFNAWEAAYEIQKTDGTIISRTAPMIGKANAFRACGLVDVVGHLEAVEKTGKRWIRIGPHSQYITKCQFKGLDAAEPPDLTALINKLATYNYKE